MQGWIELLRSLGESLIEVVRAEVEALQGDLKRSGRHLGIALALLGAVAVLAFWIVGLIVFFLVALLAYWLPLWGAALVVLVLFAVVAAVLGLLAKRHLSRFQPVDDVKRHVDDHLDWWQNGFLAQGRPLDVPAARVTEEEDLP